MSILNITYEDTVGKGKPLPNARWAGIFEEASVQPEGNGTRFFARIGQITTPDGAAEYTNGGATAPYRIGNRKVFVREWTDHQSAQAAEIGQRRLKQIAMATGIVPKPAKGETVTVPFETYEQLAQAIVGTKVLFTTKQSNRLTKKPDARAAWSLANEGREAPALVPALDADGEQIVDVEVAAFHVA